MYILFGLMLALGSAGLPFLYKLMTEQNIFCLDFVNVMLTSRVTALVPTKCGVSHINIDEHIDELLLVRKMARFESLGIGLSSRKALLVFSERGFGGGSPLFLLVIGQLYR